MSEFQTVTSPDGTRIAYVQRGTGDPLVFVGGAFNDRTAQADLAAELAGRFTTVCYDRRGRGDSGDSAEYAVEREIEDLAAVTEAVGGRARLHGMSSGGALVMRAVAAGLPVPRFSVMEPPYRVKGAPPAPPRYLETLRELTSTDRNEDAVAYFMTDAVGQPPEAVEQARQMPFWAGLVRIAPTLVYDAHVMGDSSLPTEMLAAITTPGLAVYSTDSPAWLQHAATAVADALGDAQVAGLPGEFHRVAAPVLAAALSEFHAV